MENRPLPPRYVARIVDLLVQPAVIAIGGAARKSHREAIAGRPKTKVS